MKTDGELNYETVSTKAVTTKPNTVVKMARLSAPF